MKMEKLFTGIMIIGTVCLVVGFILAICAFFSPICFYIAAGFVITGMFAGSIGSVLLGLMIRINRNKRS